MSSAAANVLRVDAAATGANDGTSWFDAFSNLQSALAAAHSGDEIWIARGTYKPAGPNGSRDISFELPPGVSLYGGFAGGETDLAQRDFEHNATILSGDLAGDDGQDFANYGENSYHVVRVAGSGARLDGVTIQGGNATPGQSGGGVLHASGTATYANIVLRRNRAAGGGGMSVGGGAAVLRRCVFTQNAAVVSGGGLGAATQGNTLWSCSFLANSAQYGGAFSDGYGGQQFVNCVFSGNSAQYGGAVSESDSFTSYLHCTFSLNHATTYAGGIQSNGKLGSHLDSCILWGNGSPSGTVLENQDDAIGATTHPWMCTVQGLTGTALGDNNGLDPLLVDPLGADGLAGTRDDDLRIQVGSPCIDAASTTAAPESTDFDGLPRSVDDPNTPSPSAFNSIRDRGAHEYQPCASPENYCVTSPNSVGAGSIMGFAGTASLHADNLVLRASGNPPNALGIFFHGTSAAQSPFGNGVRCVGGSVVRLPLVICDASGQAQYAFDAAASPTVIHPGDERRFQFWYRNPAGGGAGFNLSDALLVSFCP